MSIFEGLQALAGGEMPADLLLNTCRLEWAGAEAYGEEAIAELFRDQPMAFGEDAMFLRSATGAVLIDGEQALVADVYGDHVGRLWRMGSGEAPDAEPAVAVAFDPDLRQQRGDVYFRAQDYPELAAGDEARVVAGGRALVARVDGGPVHRARAFVVRAFSGEGSSDAGGAVLYAVHRVEGGATRTAGFGYAASAWVGDHRQWLIVDQRRPAPWTPRL